MLLSILFSNPAVFVGYIIALVISISFHEFAHAATANALGDKTPKYEGRLTLNPLAHLDPMGTILLLLVGFGWGKPVPFNPYNLKYQRFGPAFVSAAGPISNLIVVLVSAVVINILAIAGVDSPALIQLFGIIIMLNMVLMLFNLIPVAPLDGSKVLYSFLPSRMDDLKISMERYGPMILLALIIFDNVLGFNIFGHIYDLGLRFVDFLIL